MNSFSLYFLNSVLINYLCVFSKITGKISTELCYNKDGFPNMNCDRRGDCWESYTCCPEREGYNDSHRTVNTSISTCYILVSITWGMICGLVCIPVVQDTAFIITNKYLLSIYDNIHMTPWQINSMDFNTVIRITLIYLIIPNTLP